MINNKSMICTTINVLNAYATNDHVMPYKIILGMVFNKSKTLTKKKAKAEELLLGGLSKDSIIFPHSFGKPPIVALYTLKNTIHFSGIDYVGSENLIKDIQNNILVPNYLLCFKDEMPLLTKYSRVLGPKGLMPTPKQGTIIDDENIVRTITTLKKGSFKVKINKNLTTQIPVGTLSMDKDAICDNIIHVLSFVHAHLPVSFIKTNLKNLYLTTTHGPSISIKGF